MAIYGYVRASTKEQKEDRQLIAMKQENIPTENIYMDKQTGMDFNRPSRCPRIFTATINGGGRAKSQAQQPQKPVICRFRRFAIEHKFTKGLLFCSTPFYNMVDVFPKEFL